jgi:pimeloyl-ACP methyl ester carboxylesterase
LAAEQLMDKVKALILGDPPLNTKRFLTYEGSDGRKAFWRAAHQLMSSRMPVQELASALADLYGMNQDDCLEWAEMLNQTDPDVIMYHAEGRLDEYVAHIDLGAALQRLTCPTLLLQCDPAQGGILSDEDVELVMGLLANGTHAQLKGVGHDLGLGAGDVAPLLRAVTGFLQAL